MQGNLMYERYHLYINNTVSFLRCMFYLYLCHTTVPEKVDKQFFEIIEI